MALDIHNSVNGSYLTAPLSEFVHKAEFHHKSWPDNAKKSVSNPHVAPLPMPPKSFVPLESPRRMK